MVSPFLQALLALLARSCLLPGRVVELVADNPSVLTDLRIDELEGRIAHLKAETTPMGSQLAALWQKFPQVRQIFVPQPPLTASTHGSHCTGKQHACFHRSMLQMKSLIG